jgi:hypothetical protein
MHYRVKRAKVRTGYILPPLIDQLGLRASDAKESIQTVKKLVIALAKLEQRESPEWVTSASWSALEMEL